MKIAFVLLLTGFFLVQDVTSQFHLPRPGNVIGTVTKPIQQTITLLTKPFSDFKNRFGKKYSSPEEEKKRLSIFSLNHARITEFTKLRELPFVVKINEFCDLVSSEFNKLLNGLKVKFGRKPEVKYVVKNEPVVDKFDWREKGVVTPIKNQGECASCYAFASAAAIESHIAIKNKNLHDISPQQVLDCSLVQPYENYGCEGGSLEPAYDYIRDHGLVSHNLYPYTATTGETCESKKHSIVANIKSYVTIDEGDEKALKEALVTKGPIAVGLDASAESWQFYGGGIYYESECKSAIEDLNHAVLLVGYGEENGNKYWIVKNSYGDSWGEEGYARIARNETNHCGIASYAVYPEL